MATISEILSIGVQHHQAGRLQVAEQLYRQILTFEPENADALHLLGVIFFQTGQFEPAIETIERAIKFKGTDSRFHCNLGNVFKEQRKYDRAITCYRRAIQLAPRDADAHNNLGAALKEQGNLNEAIACYCRALERNPNFAGANNNLAVAYQEQGNLPEAIACYRRLLELKKDDAETCCNVGVAFNGMGNLDEAVACYMKALKLKPDYPQALNNLGIALNSQGKRDEAIGYYRRALELKPDYARAHNNLGVSFSEHGRPDEAAACYRRALELKPDYPQAYTNLGNVLKDQGKMEEAVVAYRQALKLNPDYVKGFSNLLGSLIFCPGYDAETLCQEHLRWNQRFGVPLAKSILPHSNDRTANRRLRVGYVSPHFREHVVGLNMLPLFREHDRQQFEIFCYAQIRRPDECTGRFRSYANVWRDVAGLTDEVLAQQIRADGIDILVDLTLHMDDNRLLVFATKPAPIQVTFAGYPGTTGLLAIDYRLTDQYLDPPGGNDHVYTEKSIRLPDSFWCYDPLSQQPEVNPLPASDKRYITFGCLNNFCKTNPPLLKLWARVLNAVEHSKLMILAALGSHRQQTLDLLEREGITPDRVEFVAGKSRTQYLENYHRIDVGLDTLPYNGHTTSLDSFWMGVPVITLVGETVVGRAGLCQLQNLGLPELIAQTPAQFVEIAVELANDLPRLSQLRATLRGQMQNSPLMDAPRFARNIEAAYREMWQRWCASH